MNFLLISQYKAKLVRSFTENSVPLFAAGKLKTIVDSVLPMDQIQLAHEKMESNKNIGKIVVQIAAPWREHDTTTHRIFIFTEIWLEVELYHNSHLKTTNSNVGKIMSKPIADREFHKDFQTRRLIFQDVLTCSKHSDCSYSSDERKRKLKQLDPYCVCTPALLQKICILLTGCE